MRPSPPSSIRTMATARYINGLPDLRTAIAINKPIALEPASPISSLLGVALNQR